MKKFRKIVAFIIIMLIVSVIVLFIAGSSIISLVATPKSLESSISNITINDNGNIFYINEQNNEYYISRMNGQGSVEKSAQLPEISNTSNYLINDMYCDNSGAVFLNVYKYNNELTNVDSNMLYRISPDFATSEKLVERVCTDTLYYERIYNNTLLGYTTIENDRYFVTMHSSEAIAGSYCTNVYKYSEANGITTLFEYTTDEKPTAAGMIDSSRLLLCTEGGKISCINIFEADIQANTLTETYSGMLFTQFMQGSYYTSAVLMDGASNALCNIEIGKEITFDPANNTFTPFFIDDTTLGDLNIYYQTSQDVSVALSENMVIYMHNADNLVLEPIDTSVNYNRTGNLLLFAAIVLGVILVSFGIWIFYVHRLKMKLSLVARQSLAIFFIVTAVINILLSEVIQPQYSSLLMSDMQNRMVTMASMFASEVETDAEGYGIDITTTSELLSDLALDVDQMGFALYEETIDGVKLRASSANFEDGILATSPSLTLNAVNQINDAYEKKLEYGYDNSSLDNMFMAFIRVPGADNWMAQVFVSNTRIYVSINNLFAKITLQFNITALILVLLLFVYQMRTVRGIKRLARGVDMLSKGDMSVMIVQRSGDELENLAHSFNGMTDFLRATFGRMETINKSYFRFVPEKLVSLMGESSIENLGKHSHTKKKMVVMVLWFEFCDKRDIDTTNKQFDNINEVIERASHIVSVNNGTVYDFTYDGFNAVFEDDPDIAVSTAVAIRQEILTLNDQRIQRGAGKVDLRIALDRGSVMMGIIGDENRMAPTAIAEAITASRQMIEACRTLDIYMLCSEIVAKGASSYSQRYIGNYIDRGGEKPLYEIFEGDPYRMRSAKRTYAKTFDKAVELMYQRKFIDAKQLFMDIVKLESSDGVARTYLYLADKFAREEPSSIYLLERY